jgi:hypothetical protein
MFVILSPEKLRQGNAEPDSLANRSFVGKYFYHR